jgi:hypothetical protein
MGLKTGDIFFVDKNNKWGDIVGWFQGNRWHHVGIVIKLFSKVWVFEALAQGMVFTPLSKYEKNIEEKGWSILVTRLKNDEFENVKRRYVSNLCLHLTSVSYEFINLIGYQAIRYAWLKLTGKNIWVGRKQAKSNKTMICSELVGYIYFKCLGMFKNDWWKLSPSDIIINPYFEVVEKIGK